MYDVLKPTTVSIITGWHPVTIRQNIKNGTWTFGECIPGKKRGCSTDAYFIYRAKLETHLGRKIPDDEIVKAKKEAARK